MEHLPLPPADRGFDHAKPLTDQDVRGTLSMPVVFPVDRDTFTVHGLFSLQHPETSCIHIINDSMNCTEQWQLRVAEHKCLVLSHGNCDSPSYYLKDVNLDNVDHHKDVAIIVDDHCLFKQHVSYICKKAYCFTNVLFR